MKTILLLLVLLLLGFYLQRVREERRAKEFNREFWAIYHAAMRGVIHREVTVEEGKIPSDQISDGVIPTIGENL